MRRRSSSRSRPFGRVDGHHRHLPLDAARFFIHFLDGLGALSLLLAHGVEAEVDDDARHPGGETRFALELHQPLPALHPGFLRKINRFILIPHHAVGPRVNLVAMPGHQFLKGRHVALLRRPHQRLVLGGGLILVLSSVGRGCANVRDIQGIGISHYSFPLVLGNWPAMRGSRWQATSTALAKALKRASSNVVRLVAIEQFQVQVAPGFVGEALEELPGQAETEGAGHVLRPLRSGELLMRLGDPARARPGRDAR